MRRPKPIERCAVCDKALARTNRSGVCQDHNHASGFCRCGQCVRAGRYQLKDGEVFVNGRVITVEEQERQDAKRAKTTNQGDTVQKLPVSLPRAPWEKEI